MQWSLTLCECLFEPKSLIRTYVYFFYDIITAWWEERCRKKISADIQCKTWDPGEASSPFFRGDVSDVLPPDGLDEIAAQKGKEGDGVPRVPAVVCQQGNLQQRCIEYPTLSQNKKYNHFKSLPSWNSISCCKFEIKYFFIDITVFRLAILHKFTTSALPS